MEVHRQRLDENAFAAENLYKSLILSDRAKKFGIAREVMHTNDNHVYVQSGMFCAVSAMAYVTGMYAGAVMDIKRRLSRSGRGFFYATIGFGFLTLYLLFSDAYECRRHRRSDRWAAELGESYFTKARLTQVCLTRISG